MGRRKQKIQDIESIKLMIEIVEPEKLISQDVSKQLKIGKSRVARILKSLGYQLKIVKENGRSKRIYKKM